MGAFLDKLTNNIKAYLDKDNLGKYSEKFKTAQDLVTEAKNRIEDVAKKEGISGIPSGFTILDKLTGGWQSSDLIIIGARPGMGKTAFSLTMARNIAIDENIPVAIFSLEMSSVQIITRLMSMESRLSSEKLRTGKLQKHEWEQLNVRVSDLEKAPLHIDDTPSLSTFDLRLKARRLSSKYDIKLIIIDHLQLMTLSNYHGDNREHEMFMITRHLKALAKELNIPIIILSQVSRDSETRKGDKRPLLCDVPYYESIEHHTDIVGFIYRPEYYKIDTWNDEERSSTEGQAEFIISKHRNGSLENIRLRFMGHLGKFENLYDFEDSDDDYDVFDVLLKLIKK